MCIHSPFVVRMAFSIANCNFEPALITTALVLRKVLLALKSTTRLQPYCKVYKNKTCTCDSQQVNPGE